MGDGTLSKPLSAIGELGVETKSDAPPEPPSRPFSGPPFEEKGDAFLCKVPGCSKPQKLFSARHAIAGHLIRMHGLGLNGMVYQKGSRNGSSAAPAAPLPPPVNLRGLIVGTEQALIAQAVRIVEKTIENLSGKLADMEILKRKEERLATIVQHMKELI